MNKLKPENIGEDSITGDCVNGLLTQFKTVRWIPTLTAIFWQIFKYAFWTLILRVIVCTSCITKCNQNKEIHKDRQHASWRQHTFDSALVILLRSGSITITGTVLTNGLVVLMDFYCIGFFHLGKYYHTLLKINCVWCG